MSERRLALVTLVVRDYDEAIAFFAEVLGFRLLENADMGAGKRWVVVAPEQGAGLLLAKANGAEQIARVGDQTGGRVGFFLHTDDFDRDHARLHAAGVRFIQKQHKGIATLQPHDARKVGRVSIHAED